MMTERKRERDEKRSLEDINRHADREKRVALALDELGNPRPTWLNFDAGRGSAAVRPF